jgi:hypothetical protein
MSNVKPEVYNKYYFKIDPPFREPDGSILEYDIVLAKDVAKATEIMARQYNHGPYKKVFKVIQELEVELFRSDYYPIETLDYEDTIK